ncbi:hypothetical protein [Thalassospira alkalitolerans]|uniref:Uncharacterized protein n=1 Tax=Thalassospira alkalitolerans TaxID=1293890 RepID=A0A1Y2LFJ1_9PROT|nr:hypothetical protein [Thalassospira alkalitolerans]OSQ49645.1 hypothetical protein TALK_04825 [Thalassospira alkalitolerans]
MLSEDLSNLTKTLMSNAAAHNGKLYLSARQTSILLDNLGLMSVDLGQYEKSHGPIGAGAPNIAAIQRGLVTGTVVSLADRRMSKICSAFTTDDGGSAA